MQMTCYSLFNAQWCMSPLNSIHLDIGYAKHALITKGHGFIAHKAYTCMQSASIILAVEFSNRKMRRRYGEKLVQIMYEYLVQSRFCMHFY